MAEYSLAGIISDGDALKVIAGNAINTIVAGKALI